MTQQPSFVGTVLVAPPETQGEFARTIILVCGHDDQGAIGIVLNKKIPSLYVNDLLEQLNIDTHDSFSKKIPLFSGGEVDIGRGFVLHSTEYTHDQSIFVTPSIFLTATLDVLNRLGEGRGPQKNLLALGYTNWEKGQLEQEIKSHRWLWTECSDDLVFSSEDEKWEKLIQKLGPDRARLSVEGGCC